MARYMVKYTQKHTGKVRESDLFDTYVSALNESLYIMGLGVAKTIVVLRDSEGEDHPDNAGKFFLWRIIK